MRNQYAVAKLDRGTGAILWTLGGANNEFSVLGLNNPLDKDGNFFKAQHDARYVPIGISGSDSTITVFDNHTDPTTNTTRCMEFRLDEDKKTALVSWVDGALLDTMTDKAHWASHCANFTRQSTDSIVVGWGLSLKFDLDPQTMGARPVFTDYRIDSRKITFELSCTRNPLYPLTTDSFFSYRAYKNEF
jgi:hypothetical protein